MRRFKFHRDLFSSSSINRFLSFRLRIEYKKKKRKEKKLKLGVTEELKKTMDFKLSTDLVDPVEYVIREGRTEQLTIVFLRRRCSGGRGGGREEGMSVRQCDYTWTDNMKSYIARLL